MRVHLFEPTSGDGRRQVSDHISEFEPGARGGHGRSRSGVVRIVGGLLIILVLAAGLAACGTPKNSSSTSVAGTNGGSHNGTTSSSNGAKTNGGGTKGKGSPGADGPTTTFYPQGHIVPPPDTPTTTPREVPSEPINQYISAGQQIVIEPDGAFWPQSLYATYQVPITWTNLSGRPQKVVFDYIPVQSPEIAPGAQFVWKWRSGGTLSYHSALGSHAVIYFQTPTPVSVPGTTTK